MALLTPSLRRKRERGWGAWLRGCKSQTYRKKREGMKIKVELGREAEQQQKKMMGKDGENVWVGLNTFLI